MYFLCILIYNGFQLRKVDKGREEGRKEGGREGGKKGGRKEVREGEKEGGKERGREGRTFSVFQFTIDSS